MKEYQLLREVVREVSYPHSLPISSTPNENSKISHQRHLPHQEVRRRVLQEQWSYLRQLFLLNAHKIVVQKSHQIKSK
jgi:hypothetical protein